MLTYLGPYFVSIAHPCGPCFLQEVSWKWSNGSKPMKREKSSVKRGKLPVRKVVCIDWKLVFINLGIVYFSTLALFSISLFTVMHNLIFYALCSLCVYIYTWRLITDMLSMGASIHISSLFCLGHIFSRYHLEKSPAEKSREWEKLVLVVNDKIRKLRKQERKKKRQLRNCENVKLKTPRPYLSMS